MMAAIINRAPGDKNSQHGLMRNSGRRWAIISAVLFVHATALSPFILSDQKNMLVIFVGVISPIFIIFTKLRLPKDSVMVVFTGLYYIAINIATSTEGRTLSIGYTLGLMAAYLLFSAALSGVDNSRKRLRKIIRFVILAYAVVSLIQAAALLAGLPAPNAILIEGLGRQNSLAVEPSHLGRAITMLLLCYLRLEYSLLPLKRSPVVSMLSREWLVLLAAITSVSLSGSALGFLALPLAVVFAFNFRPVLVLFLIILVAVISSMDLALPAAFERGLRFIEVIPSLDMRELALVDHQASVRLMAPIIFIEQINWLSWKTWLGGGLESIGEVVIGNMIGVPDEVSVVGFFPGYILTSGIIGAAIFCYTFVLRYINRNTAPVILSWGILFVLSPWNSQLFWLGLMLIRALHYVSSGLIPTFGARDGQRR